jgi:hypothetical protein
MIKATKDEAFAMVLIIKLAAIFYATHVQTRISKHSAAMKDKHTQDH